MPQDLIQHLLWSRHSDGHPQSVRIHSPVCLILKQSAGSHLPAFPWIQSVCPMYIFCHCVHKIYGMIFAVITGTPCIVFGNYNHKVEKSYEWFKELPYIHFVAEHEEIKNLDNEIERLLNLDAQEYNNDYSKKIFDKVFEEIEEN